MYCAAKGCREELREGARGQLCDKHHERAVYLLMMDEGREEYYREGEAPSPPPKVNSRE